MEWVPQEGDIKGILELLHNSRSNDTNVQRTVQEVMLHPLTFMFIDFKHTEQFARFCQVLDVCFLKTTKRRYSLN